MDWLWYKEQKPWGENYIIQYFSSVNQNSETKLTPFVFYGAYFNIERLHFYTRSTGKHFLYIILLHIILYYIILYYIK